MLESNLHVITSSDLDGLTVTSMPTPVLPESNMLDPRQGLSSRWTGTPNALDIRFTREADESAFYASGFALARHNFAVGTTARIRLYAGINQTGEVVYDSTALETAVTVPWGVFLAGIDPWADAYTLGVPAVFAHWWNPPVAYRSIRVDITQPAGNANEFIDIGRLYIGWAFIPQVNFSAGVNIEWVDPSIHNRTAGGGIRTERIAAYRRFELDLDYMLTSDRERLSHLLERVGKQSDMLVSLDPTATGRTGLENTMVCKRVSNNRIVRTSHYLHSSRLVLEET